MISEFDKSAYTKIRDNVTAFIKAQAGALDGTDVVFLDIAPQVHQGAKEFFTKSRIYTADIDINSGADYIVDICKDNKDIIPDGMFDVVLCTEVLEHTLNPFSAIQEIRRILKPAGILLMSTPFDFRIHGPLPDCWRFTEHGIRALLSEFQTVDITPLENENRFLMPIHYTVFAKK